MKVSYIPKRKMSVETVREGVTRVQILGTLAEFRDEDDQPRQTDLVDRLPVTKGAVSTNCQRLLEEGLISERLGVYALDREGLLAVYREHVEQYLGRESAREPFASDTERANEIRTLTKRRLDDLLAEQAVAELIFDALLATLRHVRESQLVQTPRDALRQTDLVIRRLGQQLAAGGDLSGADVESSPAIEAVLLLSVVTNRTHAELGEVVASTPAMADLVPGETPDRAAADLLEEVRA